VPWSLDVRTAMMLAALATWLTGGLLSLSWRSLPESVRPSLRWWLGGLALHPIGFGLLAMRGWIPDVYCIPAAATVLACSYGCLAVALRNFYSLPERRLRLVVVAILVALLNIWFTNVSYDLHLRVLMNHTMLAIMIGSGARAVFRRNGPRGRVPRITGWLFALVTLLVVMRGLIEIGQPITAAELLHPRPEHIPCLLGLLLLPLLSSVGFLLMCTERAQQQLEHTARVDYLTGIYNRRAIEELATRVISAARRHEFPLSLMIVDVDHFKRVNDQHGHACGDRALIESVARMHEILRSEDLLGRLGGEEFVVVMPRIGLDQAVQAAERLRERFADRTMRLHDGDKDIELQLTLSVGVVTLQPDDSQFSHLLRRADRAMYAAKAAGRNRVMPDASSA
jgi:diguanylate cyclase (GGDEF)-like protein